MINNLLSASNKFYEDQALIFLTFGGFGRYVLSLLHEDFRRLGIPRDKTHFLAFDTEKPHRDRMDLEVESEYFIHLDEFDGDIYVENPENEELRKSVRHIPTTYLRDIEGGCKGIPAVGFVSFHKYDDLIITREALKLVDEVRAKNPGKKIKLIMISGMGGSVSNGMSIPFLYRIQDRLREKKIRVEVFLATSEGYLGLQNVQEKGVERNCVASAMLWEYALAGKNGLVYPGKSGLRSNQKMFHGKIAHRVYVFSGGSAETSLKYKAIASTIAQCITTLETTKVGSYLDGDRVNYSAHILEREWKGRQGGSHITGLLTMNVAGFKGDCLPQLYHLHMVKRFVEKVLTPINPEQLETVRGNALSCFLGNNLNEDDIQEMFSINVSVLSSASINQENISEEEIYDFLKEKIKTAGADAVEKREKKKKREEASLFIEKVLQDFSTKADEIFMSYDYTLKAPHLFYEKLSSLLESKISTVNESITKLESDLFEGTNQRVMNNLMQKLETVSKKKSGMIGLAAKLGQSPIVVIVNQVIDTASKIQQQKKDKYNHLLLQDIYNTLFRFLQEKQEEIRQTILQHNNCLTVIDRESNTIKRMGRNAFANNESAYDELTDHLMGIIYANSEQISTQAIIEKTGSLLKNDSLKEEEYLEKLLTVIRPDPYHLASFVDNLLCRDQKVHDYIKVMLDQFYMTLKLDRDRFPTLETSRSCFVLCTKNIFDTYKNSLFEGYSHIETENPFNVMVTRHEEGFPFIAISYIYRINKTFKDFCEMHDSSALGHIMADLDDKLPLLDL